MNAHVILYYSHKTVEQFKKGQHLRAFHWDCKFQDEISNFKL